MTPPLDKNSMPACASCGAYREPGQLLLVTDRHDPARRWYVCRPAVDPRCLRGAMDSTTTSIALADPGAARAWDARP